MTERRATAPAAARWADELAAWAIPPEILAAAPESPWGFPPALFQAAEPEAVPDSPSRRRAVEALGDGGTVLDVGSGAGAASLALVPPADTIVAVDESPEMLAALAAAADERGVAHVEQVGRWPDVAASVPRSDVVVCHHVFYNVPDLAAFALALDDHARRRVVVELTATHPLTAQAPLWRHFHGIDRPEGPTAELAVAVLEEAGLTVRAEPFASPPRPRPDRAAWVAFVRRRLCLPPERDPEVDALLPADDALLRPRQVVTVWWDT
ncbi:MAG TPA: methyltransferase domain-containing protein [Acidimicrobiales bacterium]|nr:methyltransferase domain-containing protein [Acidimicrobiales bacterium]